MSAPRTSPPAMRALARSAWGSHWRGARSSARAAASRAALTQFGRLAPWHHGALNTSMAAAARSARHSRPPPVPGEEARRPVEHSSQEAAVRSETASESRTPAAAFPWGTALARRSTPPTPAGGPRRARSRASPASVPSRFDTRAAPVQAHGKRAFARAPDGPAGNPRRALERPVSHPRIRPRRLRSSHASRFGVRRQSATRWWSRPRRRRRRRGWSRSRPRRPRLPRLRVVAARRRRRAPPRPTGRVPPIVYRRRTIRNLRSHRSRSRSRCRKTWCCFRVPAPTAVTMACCCCSAPWRWESSRSRASRCCAVSGGSSRGETGRVGGGAGGAGRDVDGRVGGVGRQHHPVMHGWPRRPTAVHWQLVPDAGVRDLDLDSG